MIDAIIYAARDGLRAANIGLGFAECEIMDDPKPPPRCGNLFASVHDGAMRNDRQNQLMELYSFAVTLTMRVVVPMDRIGDQLLYRNLVRDTARKQGFYAKADQIKNLIHMNWAMFILPNQTPPSANDNLTTWVGSGTVYGFCEPAMFLNMEQAKVVGGEWFSAEPEAEDSGVKSTIVFGRCKRMQPQTKPSGPFV